MIQKRCKPLDLFIQESVDDKYFHAFLIPVIAGYLIWQDREMRILQL